DLAREVDLLVGELEARLVRVLDRAFYAVAEPKLLGEPDRDVSGLERVLARQEEVHQMAVVVGRQGVLNLGLQPEAFSDVCGVCRHSGNLAEIVRWRPMAEHYDLCVIGSGPAGEKGAAQAAYF